jgi:hypothetical protein
VLCCSGLDSIWGPQTVGSSKSCCGIGDSKVKRDPSDVGVGGEERVEFIDALLIGLPIGRDEQFGHRYCRSEGEIPGSLNPGEDRISEGGVAKVAFQVINEDAGIDREPPVAVQREPKLI